MHILDITGPCHEFDLPVLASGRSCKKLDMWPENYWENVRFRQQILLQWLFYLQRVLDNGTDRAYSCRIVGMQAG